MGTPALDPVELLARLKSNRRELRWAPLPPDEIRLTDDDGLTRNRRSLDYLHQHWVLPDAFDPAVAGGGLKGRTVTVFGKLTFRVLGPYLREERALLSHLVQANEALEKRCDALAQRLQQVEADIIDRQVAEAENQAQLALWLDLDPPDATRSSASGTDSPRTP